MSIIAGQGARLQIGKGDTWGQSAAPTVELTFVSESLRYIPNYIEEDALVAGKASSGMDKSGEKVEGGFNIIAKPDEIGLLVALAMGADSVAGAGPAFTHTITPVASSSTTSLEPFTLVVDRKVNTFGYKSCKINQWTAEASPQDYLRMTFDVIGYDEDNGDTIDDSLSESSLSGYQFKNGSVEIADSAIADVTSFRWTYNNNLENDRFTMGSGDNMAEIEPQKREITAEVDVLYSSTTDTVRESYFKAGETAKLECLFTSGDTVSGDTAMYSIEFEMPLAYIIDASPVVSGPDRITQTLSFKATENDSNEAATVTIVNGDTSAYFA